MPLKLWRFLVAVKDGLVLLLLLTLLVPFLIAVSMGGRVGGGSAVVGDGALVLELDGYLVEEASPIDPVATLAAQELGQGARQYPVRDLVRALRAAAADERVTTVVLNLERFRGGGQVALRAVGAAVSEVRRTGKQVLAWSDFYHDDNYLLASYASEVWVDPQGIALIGGPGTQQLYYRELLDRLGVEAKIYRVGDYKSAVEPFERNDQSPEDKEATRAYLDVLWRQWRSVVVSNRPTALIDTFTARPARFTAEPGAGMAEAAVQAGLVDKTGSLRDFNRYVGDFVGIRENGEPWHYEAISYDDWLRANPPNRQGSVIGVVTVAGVIVAGEGEAGQAGGGAVSRQIYRAANDDDVDALVVRIDSPGGSALASEQIRQAMQFARVERGLPVVASMANVAASGGYWVASAGDRILAAPDTITGSIGVFSIIPSVAGALEKIGVSADGVSMTPMSTQPDPLGGFSAEFDELMQADIEKTYRLFAGIVAGSRSLSLERVLEIAGGRVWIGETALQLNLIDGYGGLDEALDLAAELAGVSGDYRPRYFRDVPSQFEQLLQDVLDELQGFRAAAIRLSGSPGTETRLTGAASSWPLATVEQRIARDLELLLGSTGAQVLCLECRAAMPALPMAGAYSRGTALLRLLAQ